MLFLSLDINSVATEVVNIPFIYGKEYRASSDHLYPSKGEVSEVSHQGREYNVFVL